MTINWYVKAHIISSEYRVIQITKPDQLLASSMIKVFSEKTNLNFFFFFTSGTFTQPAIACSKLTIETLEQGVKYVQS